METPQSPYESKTSPDAPVPNIGSPPMFEQQANSNNSKMKVLIVAIIVLTGVLTIGAYVLGVRKNIAKNPAYLDPITVLKAKVFPPKVNMEGPPGMPDGWVAPLPSTTP